MRAGHGITAFWDTWPWAPRACEDIKGRRPCPHWPWYSISSQELKQSQGKCPGFPTKATEVTFSPPRGNRVK